MISNLVSYLNNPPEYTGVAVVVIVLGTLIAIGSFCLLLKNKNENAGITLLSLLVMAVGASAVTFSSNITYRLEKTNLQTELNSKMEVIDNEYPYQLSIADNNKNVYFVFCKTKDDQKKVIKTMNTGNNLTIKYSNQVATYINISQHIKNGVQVEKQISKKDLLTIVKNNFEEF